MSTLKHLDGLLPAFISELEKDGGVKETLQAGTKHVTTALKSIGNGAKALGEKANTATLRVASKLPPKTIIQGHSLLKSLVP